ncbi:MAG: CDP-alcohol phosphatidyltransferase family protein [Candidatus Aenigmatarchaeota archaeon]
MLYGRREKFSGIEEKLGRLFRFMSPNRLTMMTLIPALLTFYLLVQKYFFAAGVMLLITFLFDVIDGSVARFAKKETRFGAYLDTVVDRYVEFIIILGLLFVNPPMMIFPSYVWIILLLFGSLMTTYVKSAAIEKKMVKNLTGGIERAERGIILFFGIVFAGYQEIFLTYVIIILAILTNLSAISKFFIASRIRC